MTKQTILGLVLDKQFSLRNQVKATVVGSDNVKYEYVFSKGSYEHGIIATKNNDVKFIESKLQTSSIKEEHIDSILKSLELEKNVIDSKFKI